jgi:hypothetical protein
MVIASDQQLTLAPGQSETGYLTVGASGTGTVSAMSFGVTGNVGTLGDVLVVITGCMSSPWRTVSQAQGGCTDPVSTQASSLTQLESGAVVVQTSGITTTSSEVFRVVFSMPTSAGNNQENQDADFQEIIGLYQ